MPAVAHRLSNLPEYVFAALGARIQQLIAEGHDVIRLDIGNPDKPPPEHVITALDHSARNAANHGYSPYTGLPAFRQAVARYYQRRFGVELDPQREVLPLLGSKEGLVNFALAYLDRGDIALTPDIGYPAYSMGTRLAGGDVCFMPLRAEAAYLPNFDEIPSDVAARAKLVWVNYPNNPTGATADLTFYNRAVQFCAQHDLLLVSDNPYVEITFGDYAAPSALQAHDAKDHVVEFMSLSKSYNMAGWRLGAAVGNATAIKNLLRIKSNIDSGHFKPIYEAGIAALDETPQAWLESRNAMYQARLERILAALPEIGLEAHYPKGAIYVWAHVLNGTGEQYAERALTEASVSIAPGTAYGPGGEQYVRMSIATPDERLDEALHRLKVWYNRQ